MNEKTRTVMAFGVFDLVHDGHRHFLKAAKKLGSRLVVVVATDSSVQALKKHLPYNSLEKRIKNLKAEQLVDEVVAGDEVLGSWKVIVRLVPNVIALGYDQTSLGEILKNLIAREKLPITLKFIGPHENGNLHSSILRRKS